MDRRVLGLSAARRDRRADRLPRLGRVPRARSARSSSARLVLVGDEVELPPELADDRRRGLAAARDRARVDVEHARRVRRRRTTATRPTSPRSSSPRAPPPSRRASSSRIATSSPTSSRSSARCGSTERYARPFSPIRFLNLLPLSHMFGQAMATFVPPMLGGEVVFMRSYNPHDIVQQIRSAARLGAGLGAEDPRRAARARAAHVSRARPNPRPGPLHWSAALVALPRRASRVRLEVLGRRSSAPRRSIPALEEYWARLGFLVDPGLRPDRDGADRHAQPSVLGEEGIGRQADRTASR